MDITKLNISTHMKNDRLDRYVEIQMNTGIGNPVVELRMWEQERWMIITDTGVAIITDKDQRDLITMYYLTMEKAKALLHNETRKIMPQIIYNAIRKNIQRNLTTNSTYASKKGNYK